MTSEINDIDSTSKLEEINNSDNEIKKLVYKY